MSHGSFKRQAMAGLFVVLASLLCAGSAHAAADATVSGTAVNPAGKAVVGAKITLEPEPAVGSNASPPAVLEGKTDANGKFSLSLSGIKPGRYFLIAYQAKPELKNWVRVTVVSGESVDAGTIKLAVRRR